MMNRLVILLVVAVAVVMGSVPSEGRIKYLFLSYFRVRFSNLGNHHLKGGLKIGFGFV